MRLLSRVHLCVCFAFLHFTQSSLFSFRYGQALSSAIVRYGALRSTVSSYKGELTGSDKHFSFFLEGKPNAEHIHVFESAIDLLSFATLALLAGHDWKSETYLSLAGVFQTKRENVVPVALSRFLDEHPSVRKIHLHLDNDAVGRGAVKGIVGGLQGRYQVYDEPPSRGKDVNDELKIRVGLKLSKQNVILYLCGIIPVVWLGLLIAPCLKDGLPGLVQQFGSVMQNPFKIQLCEDSVKTVLTFVGSVAQYLVEAEVLPDFTPAFYTSTTSKRKIYRVDGYVFDEFDYTMNLIIADYDGVEERTMGKVVSSTNFQRLAVFVDQALNTNLYREIEMSTPCADLVDLLRLEKERIRKYRLLIFTDADVSDTLKNLDSLDIGGIPAECQIWDIDRVFRVCCSDLGRQNIEIDFREYIPAGIPCLEASSAATAEYNSYLCIIPGKVLADIYDKYGSQLLEGNVRSFLSTKVAVNKKIRETILKCPSMFFAYNNGVSATAMDVQLERTAGGTHIVGARDFQIINGGQTTASLSNTRHKDKADLEGIYVQMKLTEIDESDMDRSTELVRNISRSSNSQNKVTDADFFSTHPFHIRMEQHSRRIFAPAESGAQYETKWFYERAKGQFLQAQMRLTPAKKRQFLLQNPKSKVITKTDLAKVRNTWSEMPHIVSKGAQTNFMKFAELIDEAWTTNDSQFNERYFTESVALVILFKHLEALIPRQEWYEQGYRANIVTYSLALLHQLIRKQFKNMELDLQSIWQRQSVPEIVTKALEQIAEQVFYRITDPNRPTINVTQWCKREGCWNSVQEINLILPAEFSSVLIGKTEVRAAEKEARKDQKVLSETEAQVKVLQYSADQWKKLSAFVMQKRMASPDENVALKYACQIPNKMPSGYQSQRLLALLDRALSEGFNL